MINPVPIQDADRVADLFKRPPQACHDTGAAGGAGRFRETGAGGCHSAAAGGRPKGEETGRPGARRRRARFACG